jgi:fructose-bisphosphate aldolase class 1
VLSRLNESLDRIHRRLDEQHIAITNIQKQLAKIIQHESNPPRSSFNLNVVALIILAIGIVFHAILMWILARKQNN